MPLHLEEKYKKIFELGRIVEDIFELTCKMNNIPVIRASRKTDMKNRIDFYVEYGGRVQMVDVKARRRLSRCDFSRWGIIHEIRNTKGELTIYKKYTHIAYEIAPAVFIVVPKKVISSILRDALREYDFDLKKGYLGEKADYFNFYTRNGKDLVAIFPEEWFINKAKKYEGVWEVYTDCLDERVLPLVEKQFKVYREIKVACLGRK